MSDIDAIALNIDALSRPKQRQMHYDPIPFVHLSDLIYDPVNQIGYYEDNGDWHNYWLVKKTEINERTRSIKSM